MELLGRFLRVRFFKKYLGEGGVKKFPWKYARSEDPGPSLTIQEFFQNQIPGFICVGSGV